MDTNYLESCIKQFEYYKMLGDKTFEQLTEEQLFWQTTKKATVLHYSKAFVGQYALALDRFFKHRR